jgi:deazaflavin-dependent oxidoreductase (nitroreductase family)
MNEKVTRLPPRWFIRTAWVGHRALYRVTGGRVGLARPTEGGRFGMLRLHAIGRRSGQERIVILGYYEDGPNLVTLAMNGWGDPPPAWWLNLTTNPDARVDLVDGGRAVRARAAEGEERARLWAAIREYDGYGDIDVLSAGRSSETTVVVLEPRT